MLDGYNPAIGLDASPTLTQGLVAEIHARIADRRLAPGARLPSIRALAEAMGVSKTTVVEAYGRLAAAGTVTPRRGSGFYVAEAAAMRPSRRELPSGDRVIDSFWLTLQAREAGPELLKPGSGWLPDAWMPHRAIQAALREASRDAGFDRVGYDLPLGHEELRHQVSRRLGERGVEAPSAQVLLTDGGTQALDLVLRLLLSPGDAVVIDDPCYFNFHAMLAAHGLRAVAVPYTPDGPDLQDFSEALRAHRPRLYLTNSGCHNPTGSTLTPAVAYRLLRLAEEHDVLVVEDDVFADLEHEPAPRLAAFDGLRRVICVGSFSKTVSAALRCGFVAVPDRWMDDLVRLKLATSFGNGQLAAGVVHRVLLDGGYRRHVDGLRTQLAAAMSLTVKRLAAVGMEPWLIPRAGMFVWARLPGGCDAARVARHALSEGVVMAPGEIFSASPAAGSFMRFNVSRCTEPRIFDVLRAAIREA